MHSNHKFTIIAGILLCLIIYFTSWLLRPSQVGWDVNVLPNTLFGNTKGSNDASSARKPTPKTTCKIMEEFRDVNFQDRRLSSVLCKGIVAYQLQKDGEYPPCVLAHPLNETMLQIARNHSVLKKHPGAEGNQFSIYAYPSNIKDVVSGNMLQHGQWEALLIRRTLAIAKLLPDTTFVDIGSNIGLYTLAAVQVNLPTVAADANFRNVVRLRASLVANGFNPANVPIVWSFFTPEISNVQYLLWPTNCDAATISGVKKPDWVYTDTIPVMPLRAERLRRFISTRNVVIKIDIEGGEIDFLRTSGSFFQDVNIVAVQMEMNILHTAIDNKHFAIVDFMTKRKYVPFNSNSMKKMDAAVRVPWTAVDVLWLRHDYVDTIMKMKL